MIHDYDLSIEEVEAGVLAVHYHSWLHRKFKANLGCMVPWFKKQKNKANSQAQHSSGMRKSYANQWNKVEFGHKSFIVNWFDIASGKLAGLGAARI